MNNKYIRRVTAAALATLFFFLASMGILPSGGKVNADEVNPGIAVFVRSLYSDCLGRTADPVGLNDWCSKLVSGEITGKEAAYGFFFSQEFQSKANTWSDDQLIETYYHVFLNRDPDASGRAYWRERISGTTNDISLLFTGFADSSEFAQKCASYGITVGGHIDVPETVRNHPSGGGNGSAGMAYQTNGMRAGFAEELDAYWTSQGYEIFYIDLGNGQTQKSYALFFDMTGHNNELNSWRNQNGKPSLTVLTDISDPRVQWARTRAVEVAYSFSHSTPYSIGAGRYTDPRTPGGNGGENIGGGLENTSIDGFRNSPAHNRGMLTDTASCVSTACCQVAFVQSDGVSLYTTADGWIASPTELLEYNGGLARGYATATVQCFWD